MENNIVCNGQSNPTPVMSNAAPSDKGNSTWKFVQCSVCIYIYICICGDMSESLSFIVVCAIKNEEKLSNKNMNCLLIFIFQLRRKLTFPLSLSLFTSHPLCLCFSRPIQMHGVATATTATVAATIVIMPRLPLIWL